MAGFGDRLAAMKAKQEAGTVKKSEQMEAEQKAKETAEKKSELLQRREAAGVAFASAEKQKTEAEAAIAEANAFAEEQGDNLDAEAKTEIDALKAEAEETFKNFEALKNELEQIDGELEMLEGTELQTTEPATEEATQVVETLTEVAGAEATKVEEQETVEEKQPFDEEQKSFIESRKNINRRGAEYRQILKEVEDELVNKGRSTRLAEADPRVQNALNTLKTAKNDAGTQELLLRKKSLEAGWKFDRSDSQGENKVRIVYKKLDKLGGTNADSEKLIVEK